MQIGVHACDRYQGQGKNARFDIVPERGEEKRSCRQEPHHGVPGRGPRNVTPARGSISEDIVAAVTPALLDLLGRQSAIDIKKPGDTFGGKEMAQFAKALRQPFNLHVRNFEGFKERQAVFYQGSCDP